MSKLDADNKFVLEQCGHAFCKECCKATIKSLVDMSHFPLKCPQCQVKISISDILLFLKGEERSKFLRMAKKKYVNSSERYLNCPTPDCEGLSLINETNFVCYICEGSFCMKCKVTHRGLTCQENELRKDPVLQKFLRERGSLCPKCKVPIEKVGGCNHVRCPKCNIHICWWTGCMQTFSTSEQCYMHMSTKHGGYYS